MTPTKRRNEEQLKRAEILAFSEKTGIMDALPEEIARVGRWTILRWPEDGFGTSDEAWIAGEPYGDVPAHLATRLYRSGRAGPTLKALLARWEASK